MKSKDASKSVEKRQANKEPTTTYVQSLNQHWENRMLANKKRDQLRQLEISKIISN
jgi:hypothetical protein